MIIEGEFFKLTPVNDHSNFFDLELLYNVGGKNPRKEYKIAAYGVTLEHAIDKISRHIISKNHAEEVITLKQYIKEYKDAQENITKLLS